MFNYRRALELLKMGLKVSRVSWDTNTRFLYQNNHRKSDRKRYQVKIESQPSNYPDQITLWQPTPNDGHARDWIIV